MQRAYTELNAMSPKPLKAVDDYMLFGGDFWSHESEVLRDMPYIKVRAWCCACAHTAHHAQLCRAKGVRARVELVSMTSYKLFASQVAAVTGFDQAHLAARNTEARVHTCMSHVGADATCAQAAYSRERFAEQRLLHEFRAQVSDVCYARAFVFVACIQHV
jgi:hypothetical protein